MIKNQQPIEGRDKGDGSVLAVNSIFHTIQGEGPHAGRAAVFIRLAGCNLQCPLCDTEYSSRDMLTLDEIAEAVASWKCGLIVITGGEPFRQNIWHLVEMLLGLGYQVQIETNGKLPFPGLVFDWQTFLTRSLRNDELVVVVSPKTATIDPQVALWATAYKYVVRDGDVADDGLPISALDHPLPREASIARPPAGWNGTIYVQPCDQQDIYLNAANMQAAVDAVMTNRDPRRRLCLQMHKYANLP